LLSGGWPQENYWFPEALAALGAVVFVVFALGADLVFVAIGKRMEDLGGNVKSESS
jgi:hypothetical protein